MNRTKEESEEPEFMSGVRMRRRGYAGARLRGRTGRI